MHSTTSTDPPEAPALQPPLTARHGRTRPRAYERLALAYEIAIANLIRPRVAEATIRSRLLQAIRRMHDAGEGILECDWALSPTQLERDATDDAWRSLVGPMGQIDHFVRRRKAVTA